MRVVEWMGDCTLIIPILPSPFPSPSPISFSILIFLFSHLINTILPSSYPISFSHLILPPLPTHDYYSPIFFHLILSSNSSLSLISFPISLLLFSPSTSYPGYMFTISINSILSFSISLVNSVFFFLMCLFSLGKCFQIHQPRYVAV